MPSLPTGTVTFLFTDIQGSTLVIRGDRLYYQGSGQHFLTAEFAFLQPAIAAARLAVVDAGPMRVGIMIYSTTETHPFSLT